MNNCYFCRTRLTEKNIDNCIGQPCGWWVYCHKCGASGPTGKDKKEAVEKWNSFRAKKKLKRRG